MWGYRGAQAERDASKPVLGEKTAEQLQPRDGARSLAIRGTADQVAAVSWMIRELDQPANVKRTNPEPYRMIRHELAAAAGDSVSLTCPTPSNVEHFWEAATLLRTIVERRGSLHAASLVR